ncbi:hypothetical protein H4687_003438 [Streptomyces stelliscabiei]|uniref:PPM-type phosphatase domain-containing protein n=1 Tax=Streptomyces stelliscabiei TaxID=146820 RepID=A0A8I0P4Z5_9ACTN|nr:hypothetical protein [Streptomyces stelliscabiei]
MKKLVHRVRTGVRKSAVDYFRGDGSDWIALVGLLMMIPLIACLTLINEVWFSPAVLVLPIVAGGLLLRPASLLGLYAAAATALIVESVRLGPYPEGPARVTPGIVLVVAACGFFGLLIAQFRSRVGVPWRRGGTMLFDLRERIRVQSKLPQLPVGWHREMALRPAGGQSFSGDFVVAARTNGGRTLEVVLTDVSGKGMDAGSRALLLSGAFGGLLGSLPPHAFLPAANGYLLRQDWDEGFATSIHLVLDLDSGDYELFSAGHPPGPPAQRGHRSLGGEGRRGPPPGCLRRCPVRPGQGLVAPRRRPDAVHRRTRRDLRAGHSRRHRPPHRRGRPLRRGRLPRRRLAPHRSRGQGRQRRPSPSPDLPRRPDGDTVGVPERGAGNGARTPTGPADGGQRGAAP